ncbi:unnamed protein product [Meganyctiphanes norvegica]|uniref:Uncharacterized protein n=1 Tax=Meganyctiphanes norvegica TaxID=48144 RepID=A0AAV2PXL8_MEGNR
MVITVINQSLSRSSNPSRTCSESFSRGTTPKRSIGYPKSGLNTPVSLSSDSSSRDSTPVRITESTSKDKCRKTGAGLLKPNQFTLKSANYDQPKLKGSRSWQNLSPEMYQQSFATLGKQEFQRDSRTTIQRSAFKLEAPPIQIRSASVGSPTDYVRRQTCIFEAEKPLPAIFSIFD